MIDPYPLTWPFGRERTARHERRQALFDTSFARARDNLVREIRMLMGARGPASVPGLVISSNLPVRRDGLPYSMTAKNLDDPGVAVYFVYAGHPRAFSCDRWILVEDNVQAIWKTIEALRGIQRWGTGAMMQAAFSGFTQLAAPVRVRHWRVVMGFDVPPLIEPITRDDVQRRFRALAASLHPDAGGSDGAMSELNVARDQALRELSR